MSHKEAHFSLVLCALYVCRACIALEQIAQQVVTGAAPKQKTPFRLWKSKTGEEGYDKKTPS